MNKTQTLVEKVSELLEDNLENIDFEELDSIINDFDQNCRTAINDFFLELANFDLIESVSRTNAENACRMLNEVLSVMVEEGDILCDDYSVMAIWGRSPTIKDAVNTVIMHMTEEDLLTIYEGVKEHTRLPSSRYAESRSGGFELEMA